MDRQGGARAHPVGGRRAGGRDAAGRARRRRASRCRSSRRRSSASTARRAGRSSRTSPTRASARAASASITRAACPRRASAARRWPSCRPPRRPPEASASLRPSRGAAGRRKCRDRFDSYGERPRDGDDGAGHRPGDRIGGPDDARVRRGPGPGRAGGRRGGVAQLEKLVGEGQDGHRAARSGASLRSPSPPTSAAACEGADLVVEAAPENMELKVKLLGEVVAIAPPHALIASNTSSLSLTELGTRIGAADRTVGLHFFNPPPVMELLEIVRGIATSDATVERAIAFAREIGKTPIVVRDMPGFATSRLGVILGAEAIRMLESGVASAVDIDRAMELGYRHPMGPLKLTDLVGPRRPTGHPRPPASRARRAVPRTRASAADGARREARKEDRRGVLRLEGRRRSSTARKRSVLASALVGFADEGGGDGFVGCCAPGHSSHLAALSPTDCPSPPRPRWALALHLHPTPRPPAPQARGRRDASDRGGGSVKENQQAQRLFHAPPAPIEGVDGAMGLRGGGPGGVGCR